MKPQVSYGAKKLLLEFISFSLKNTTHGIRRVRKFWDAVYFGRSMPIC
jgi:hypothetical protein